MKQSNRRISSWRQLLIVFLTLASADVPRAETIAQAKAPPIEARDFAWHSPTCRADRARVDARDAASGEDLFVDAAQARKVLTTTGSGRLEINSLQGKPLTVHVFRPSQFDSTTGRIWFVMHGTSRDAERYLQTAAPVAERYQVLVVALEFSRNAYPNGDAYTLGLVTQGRVDARAADEGRWRSPLQTPYVEVERTFSAIKEALQSQQPGYYLFGHSAGAQFVHRLLTFVRCPRVLSAVAANAGWYTLPTIDKKWPPFPYSLRGAAREFQDPGQVLAAPLTLLLGTLDTRTKEEDPHLRASAGAMAQGSDRLQRGITYYEVGLQAARNKNMPLAWKLQWVPGAGHEVAEIITPAAQRLFAPQADVKKGMTTYDDNPPPRLIERYLSTLHIHERNSTRTHFLF